MTILGSEIDNNPSECSTEYNCMTKHISLLFTKLLDLMDRFSDILKKYIIFD